MAQDTASNPPSKIQLPEGYIFNRVLVRNDRVDKLPLEQDDRQLLAFIFNYIVGIGTQTPNNSITLEALKQGLPRPFQGLDSFPELKLNLQRLDKWDLLSISGAVDWNTPKEVQITITIDGMYAGSGFIQPKEITEIVNIANDILLVYTKMCIDYGTPSIEEKRIFTEYHRIYGGIPQKYSQAIKTLLRIWGRIKIESPGEGRGIWWTRKDGMPTKEIPESTPDDPHSSYTQFVDVNIEYKGTPEEIMRLLQENKAQHECELKLIKQIQSQLEILIKGAKEDDDTELQNEALQLLGKITGIDNLFDAIILLKKWLTKHPEWKEKIVPKELEPALGPLMLPSKAKFG